MAFDPTPDLIKNLIGIIQSKDAGAEENSDGKEDIDSETIDEQIALRKAQRLRYISDTGDRKWLAEWSTTVVSLWLFFVFFILIKNSDSFHLSDSVLSVLLGTTTLNVLGLMYIVLKGHFNNHE